MADLKITQLDPVVTPADADLAEVVQDVATTPVNKKITWTQIKAFLKTYFDTLYSATVYDARYLGINDTADDADLFDGEASSFYATVAGVQTITNKRNTKRAPTVTQHATPTINTDVTDVAHIVGLAQAITSMTTNLSGTPVQGDQLRIDITDNGTARAIAWGASFEDGADTLPTTTVISTRLDILFFWNTVTSKWRCMAKG